MNRIGNKIIVLIGLSVIVTVLTAGLGWAGVGTSILGTVGTNLKGINGSSKYLSYEYKTYYPKGGEKIKANTFARKLALTCYAQKNLKGKSTSVTCYRVRQITG